MLDDIKEESIPAPNELFNPFWLENSERIRQFERLGFPYLVTGQRLRNEFNKLVSPYNKISEIYMRLVGLIEMEELDRMMGNNTESDLFKQPDRQLIVIKALGLAAEEAITKSYPNQNPSYEDYRYFFNFFLNELNNLQNQIGLTNSLNLEQGSRELKPLPDMVKSLFFLFYRSLSAAYNIQFNDLFNIEHLRKLVRDNIERLNENQKNHFREEIQKVYEILGIYSSNPDDTPGVSDGLAQGSKK